MPSEEFYSSDKQPFCRYCYELKEPSQVYRSHFMFKVSGAAECPKLRRDGCPNCRDRGDKAHVADMCEKLPVYRTQRVRMKKAMPLRVQLLKRLWKKSWFGSAKR